MKQIFTRSFLRKIKKSKTMLFNIFVMFLGVLEYNLHLFYEQIGAEYYGLVFVILSTIGMYLRSVTTQSLDDKP